MKKRLLNNFVLALALCVLLLCVHVIFAAPDVSISNNTVAPFATIQVSTGSTKLIGVNDNDLIIAHTGLQNDGTTASAATDYVIVMVSTGSMTDVTTAGSKLYIPAGGTATIRGFDGVYVGADNLKEFIVQAYGHGATLQLIKGSKFGSTQ